jgi:hypothetical protein
MNLLYPKIYAPFMRHTEGPLKNKLDKTRWYSAEFEALKDVPWVWTEKIDGTNIRLIWDGHRVTVGGRTANAQLNWELADYLHISFPEELFEQQFKDTKVALFGEGYGAGINKGGLYSATKQFALFDVAVEDPEHPLGYWWLEPRNVQDVASGMGCQVVAYVGTFPVEMAIETVEDGLISLFGNFPAEGMVGRPLGGFLSRKAERIMMKIKGKDFSE